MSFSHLLQTQRSIVPRVASKGCSDFARELPRIASRAHYIPVMKNPVIARSRRAGPILVCSKCLKRNSDGKDMRRTLKRQLKQQRSEDLKAPRIVMTGCFGICPKRAVVMASGQSLQRGEFVLTSHSDDIEAAVRILQSDTRPDTRR
jgi:hypothetical protein